MAKTPILLSMMATAIEQDLIDPNQQYHFPILALYRAYTERWIERDRNRAKLTPSQRRSLSEGLADHMIWAGVESELWPYVVDVLRRHPDWLNSPLSEDETALDIRRSGFLIRDIDDRYRFNHRSIQEYLAAEVESKRLREGARPRHTPSDGFGLFLSNMLAEAWSAEGALPLAIDPAHHGITDVARAQLSLLAAASATLPPDVRVNCTVGHPMFTTNEIQWRQVDFRRCRINHTGQDVSFYRCAFSNCVIDLKEFASPTIVECKFDETRITFDRLPDWPDVHWILDAPQQRLGIPGYIWDLAALLDDGAEVYIGTRKWTLSWQPLSMAAEFYRRLRGKILVRNFATGPYATQLQEFIPGLSTAQWIIVDSSREETAIELTVKARAMLAKLSTHPLDVQHEFDIFKM